MKLCQGNHPKDGQPVVVKLAKVGFTIRHRHTIASVPKVCAHFYQVLTFPQNQKEINTYNNNNKLNKMKDVHRMGISFFVMKMMPTIYWLLFLVKNAKKKKIIIIRMITSSEVSLEYR